MAALFFRAHRASRIRMCTIQNSNQIKQQAKYLQTEIFRGKSGAEKTSTNTFDSGTSEEKKEKINKRFTGESWKQFEFKPRYTCEKTSQLS